MNYGPYIQRILIICSNCIIASTAQFIARNPVNHALTWDENTFHMVYLAQ